MSAVRRNFADSLEPIIYWDASYAISYIIDTELYHNECRLFRNRFKSEEILSVGSDLVYNELAFFLIKQALEEEGKKRRMYWLDVKRRQPDFISQVMPDVEIKKNDLNNAILWLPTSEQVKEKTFQLMSDYSLLPTDAFHIATALENGVNSFVTLDEDFLSVDGIIVYTCLP